jgi:FO synthase
VIVQNFRAKQATPMQAALEPDFDDLAWTVAVARIIFGADMNIQVPPNLSPLEYERAIEAGVNDWGGVSPVTIDHVNPEAPWPHLDALGHATARGGKVLVERLAIYPAFALAADGWLAADLAPRVRALIDADGLARTDNWAPGRSDVALPALPLAPALTVGDAVGGTRRRPAAVRPSVDRILARASAGDRLGEGDITRLFQSRGDEVAMVAAAADRLREAMNGHRVGYVVNRNINYTNVCTYRCRFCAFSKGRGAASAELRGEPYDLSIAEIQRRVDEAWQRGATEVCMQGGIHPGYTGETYLAIARAVKEVQSGMHVHAFSPLEITQGAATLGLPLAGFLERLQRAGLGSLPGTAAEILDDEVRRVICPDKIDTAAWVAVMEAAAVVGLRATATIMYGHVESPRHWARHLLVVRDLQARCGVFTEFVPLPFVHMEAPMALRGEARHGPTWREALLMHAVARLALHPVLPSVQASWVKLGPEGARACLAAGANDLGGTLMNESISRAAGTEHGQELPPAEMDALIIASGRDPWQRTTLQGAPDPVQVARSYAAGPLEPVVLERAGRLPRIRPEVPA